ncbi:SHOCT domain-containing protein [Gordonia alkaliphila]|uniref:SHOCT domain-containing protein n=1 Tax=Gordonia alkaliphila TaxID=1053547 RepID=A0ABP8ZFL9_9ACTN|nr:SHOCT domain-containing protein [Gordonia alkaliphila]MCK0439363.1 SHOCT domain-containing protein [Gordonia alkaliphila]
MLRNGRPGLIGLAARTAVVTGTANAMGNRAANRRAQQQQETQQQQLLQQQAWEAQQAQQQQMQQQQMQQAQQQAPPPAAPAGGVDLTAELMKLADLRTQGLLTDDEFAAAKAKLLA